MINDKLIDVFLQNAEQEDLIRGIKEILNHFKLENEYRYEKLVNNLVNIIGGDKLVTVDDIDIELIKADISNFTYKSEEIDKDSIEISNIDNIVKTIKIINCFVCQSGIKDDLSFICFFIILKGGLFKATIIKK